VILDEAVVIASSSTADYVPWLGAQSRRMLLHLATYGPPLQSRIVFDNRHLTFAEDGW
jgi:hypothetical protein